MEKYLILLSGWGVDKFVWTPLCDLLSKEFQIILIDWENVYSVDGFKQKVITLLEEKGIDRFSIMGWSLGSLAAIDIARVCSSRIDQMILFSGTSRFTKDETGDYHIGWDKKIIKRMMDMLKNNPEEVLNNFYENLFTHSEVNNGHYGVFLKEVNVLNKEYSIETLCAGLEYLIVKDFRENIRNINIPVLLIHGDRDLICPVEAGIFLVNNLQMSELIILNETGHMPFYTKPNQCCKIIKNHMISRKGSSG